MGIFLFVYLLIGIGSTLILVRPEEGESYKDLIVDMIISTVLWPLITVLTLMDMFDR